MRIPQQRMTREQAQEAVRIMADQDRAFDLPQSTPRFVAGLPVTSLTDKEKIFMEKNIDERTWLEATQPQPKEPPKFVQISTCTDEECEDIVIHALDSVGDVWIYLDDTFGWHKLNMKRDDPSNPL